jgi:hypothetical protein
MLSNLHSIAKNMQIWQISKILKVVRDNPLYYLESDLILLQIAARGEYICL